MVVDGAAPKLTQMAGSTIASQVMEQIKPVGTSPPGALAEPAASALPACPRISPPQPAAERLMARCCARISSTCACRSSQLDERVTSVLSIGEDGWCIGGWRGPVGLEFDPPPTPPDPTPAPATGAVEKAAARLRMALTTVDERRVLGGFADVDGVFELERAMLLPDSFL